MKKVYFLLVLICLGFTGFCQSGTATPNSLTFGSVIVGTTSAPLSFSLNASGLTGSGNLTITAPTGFEVSTSIGSGYSASGGSITVPYSAGILTPTTIYVEFVPVVYMYFSGVNVAVTGGGLASPINVAVSGTGTFPCTGTPTVGTAVVSPTSGNGGTPFTLSLSGSSGGGGVSYQWQSSPYATFGFTNLGTASTLSGYSFTGVSAGTFYRCIATCPATGLTSTSNVVGVTVALAPSSCTPSTEYICTGCGFSLAPFKVTGENGTSINDNTAAGSAYYDLTASMGCTLNMGKTYTFTVGDASGNPVSDQIWIDFNNNGSFEASESIGGTTGSSGAFSIACLIPASGIVPGVYRMRAVLDYTSGGGPSYPGETPCPTSSMEYAESRDYKVTIQGPGCIGTPTAGTIVPNIASACTPFTSSMLYTTTSISSGLSYQWQSCTDSVSFAPLSGATSIFYAAPVIGKVFYNVVVTCNNSGSSSTTATQTLNLLTVPTPISGPSPLCMPIPSVLSSTPGGGSWTSSNPSIATIGFGSGIANGLTSGAVVFTYTLADGCTATLPMNVTPAPVAISGATNVCAGSSTAALFDASTGGTWSSSNTSVATVGTSGASTGVVNGILAGPVNILYTLPSGCTAVDNFTVNSNPLAIVGSNNVCIGSNITLTDPTGGGTWACSNFNASVGATSGLVSGMLAGPATIKYVLPTGCQTTMPFTVNSLPLAITSSTSGICVGGSTTLSDFGAGTWSSSNTSLATIGMTSGMVTGIAPGNPFFVFTLNGTGCSTYLPLTINPLPPINNVTISNEGNYCVGGTGVHIGLNGSSSDINYDLWSGTVDYAPSTPGTSSALDFGGSFTVVGSYSVVATNPVTGCMSNMNGSVNVNAASPLPNIYTVMGSGSNCAGGPGVTVFLDTSDLGVSYQLYYGLTPVGTPRNGTGGYLNLGAQVNNGNYTVVATNISTGCTSNMNSFATISTYPVVDTFTIIGGGNYCLGGSGSDIQLAGSDPGIQYTLMMGGITDSVTISTGGTLDFGNWTGLGSYTIQAMDPSSGCIRNMNGSVSIGTNPLPTIYDVIGGGNYCTGAPGIHVGLSYGNSSCLYGLYRNDTLVDVVGGANSALDFGLQTIPGVYKAAAEFISTLCLSVMNDSTTVGISALPYAYTVSSGAAYCQGGTGVDVNLSGSDAGTNYQLWKNGTTAVGLPISGTTIDFGNITAPGTYTVEAINPVTNCTNMMTSSSVISVINLPTPYSVMGGGSFCSGGTGAPVSISNSDPTASYQVYLDGIAVPGALVPGTGAMLPLGDFTGAGTYTVQGITTIGSCANNMTGSVGINVNPLPGVYNVTGGGNYCSGGTGKHVGINVTNTGINYQLMLGGVTPIGTAANGTGFAYDFGLKTIPGFYTVVATNPVTGCQNTMNDTAVIGVNMPPASYTLGSGGGYCAGGSGVMINLSSSDSFVSYQLMRGSSVVATMTGTNSTMNFGPEYVAGTYTAVGTNITTGCVATMTGMATVTVEPLPTVFAVTGGGNYCAGTTAGVPVSLSSANAGVNYVLYFNGSPIDSILSTGTSVTFPGMTDTGNYTIVGKITSTGCWSNMTGSTHVGSTPTVTPGVIISTGMGDSVCSGSVTFTATSANGGTAPGFHWTINGTTVSSSSSTMSYTPISGDIVSVVMTSDANCPSPATASNTQTITVLTTQTPVDNVIATPGTSVCSGTNVTLSIPSIMYGGTAPSFQWYVNGFPMGSDSSYSYVPNNNDVVFCVMGSNYPCRTANTVNSNNEVFTIDSAIRPVFMINADPGTSIAKYENVIFSANVAAASSDATFQWKVGTTVVGTNSTYSSYSLLNGDTVSCTITSHSASCGTSSTTQSVVMSVNSLGVNSVANGNNDVNIVPNPNKGAFTVKGTLANAFNGNVTIEVTNMLGQVVYTGKTMAQNGVINEQVQLDNNLANGMYILSLNSGSENSVFHFVIEQ